MHPVQKVSLEPWLWIWCLSMNSWYWPVFQNQLLCESCWTDPCLRSSLAENDLHKYITLLHISFHKWDSSTMFSMAQMLRILGDSSLVHPKTIFVMFIHQSWAGLIPTGNLKPSVFRHRFWFMGIIKNNRVGGFLPFIVWLSTHTVDMHQCSNTL